MTVEPDPLARDDDADEELEDEDASDRAPQPGNTPSPESPPYDSGAITSPETRRPTDA